MLLWSTASACATQGLRGPEWLDSRNAASYAEKHPESEVLAEANKLIRAVNTGELAPIEAWMSEEMRSHYRDGRLERVSEQIQRRYGRTLGIIEERVHREAGLTWYSGLVVYGAGAELDLLLYQFAMNGGGQLERLLIREHPFRNELRHPAEDYQTVNRFDFMSVDTWTVAHGGRLEETNKHHQSVTQRFAYDIVITKNGSWGRGSKSKNSDYYCYGKPLFAPAPGKVLVAKDGVAENRPNVRGKGGGNGAIIDHGFGEYSQLWHMIPGSVAVKVGEEVYAGQYLGRVGNSGRSTAPHIHFHVESAPPGKGGIALPAEFADIVVDGKLRNRAMPKRGQKIRSRTQGRRTAQGPVVLFAM